MNEVENLKLAKGLEASDFTSQSFLSGLAEDVEWWAAGPPELLPWAGSFRGRKEVARWVKLLYENLKYQKWDSYEWLAKGDKVIEFTHAAGYAKATGRTYETDLVRVWTVRNGKVVSVRSYYDTAKYALAIGSVEPTSRNRDRSKRENSLD